MGDAAHAQRLRHARVPLCGVAMCASTSRQYVVYTGVLMHSSHAMANGYQPGGHLGVCQYQLLPPASFVVMHGCVFKVVVLVTRWLKHAECEKCKGFCRTLTM